MANLSDLTIGTPVRVYNADFPDGNPTGVVFAINDPTQDGFAGKQILVKLDVSHPKAHGGEPLLDNDGNPYMINDDTYGQIYATQLQKGFGWYSRPEDLAVL